MKKSIELSKAEVDEVMEYGKKHGTGTFSGSIRALIENKDSCGCNTDNVEPSTSNLDVLEKFTTILQANTDSINQLSDQISGLVPISPGEVK